MIKRLWRWLTRRAMNRYEREIVQCVMNIERLERLGCYIDHRHKVNGMGIITYVAGADILTHTTEFKQQAKEAATHLLVHNSEGLK